MAECVGDGLQDEDGLLGDFGADAVAGEDGQVQEHAGISLAKKGWPRSLRVGTETDYIAVGILDVHLKAHG